MKQIFLFFLLTSQVVFSQLGIHKEEIFKQKNQTFVDKVELDGYTVYNFEGEVQTSSGKYCPEIVGYYIDNNSDECFQVTYSSCSSAANTYVKILNKMAVEIGSNKWKDYQNHSVYTLEVDGAFCQLAHFWESI